MTIINHFSVIVTVFQKFSVKKIIINIWFISMNLCIVTRLFISISLSLPDRYLITEDIK